MAFLGGKYLQPEQVITGNVQTFRAREAATGRLVFVHRIAETAQPEQAALLKLLLSCLYRSSAVKELVLDVREEGDLCFVVTESVPQCLLLREWLQFESDRSDPGTKPARGQASEARAPVSAAPQRPAPHPAVLKPSPPAQARSGPGEFTRMFEAMDPSKAETLSQKMPSPAQAPVRPVTPVPPQSGRGQLRPESSGKPQSQPPGAPTSPGEFTRLFQAPPTPAPEASKDLPASPAAARDMHVPPPPRDSDTHGTPGEFTRFFGGGSPPNPQSLSFPAVQRPISPQNVATPSQPPGEFTQLFSGQISRPVPPAGTTPPYLAPSTPGGPLRQPNAAVPSGTAGEFTRIFGGGTERPSSPGSSNSAGEYTQLFGTNDPAPVLAQPAFAASPKTPPLNEPGPPIQPPRPVPQGPSEFTRVVMGSGAAPSEPIPAAPAPIPTAPPFASAMPGVQAPAVPPVPSIPAVPHPAVPAGPALVPQSGNKPNKALLLLFLILFVLAVALVFVFAVASKR